MHPQKWKNYLRLLSEHKKGQSPFPQYITAMAVINFNPSEVIDLDRFAFIHDYLTLDHHRNQEVIREAQMRPLTEGASYVIIVWEFVEYTRKGHSELSDLFSFDKNQTKNYLIL